jgi:hypothetical protein
MTDKERQFFFVNPMAEREKSKSSEKKQVDVEPWMLDVRVNDGKLRDTYSSQF